MRNRFIKNCLADLKPRLNAQNIKFHQEAQHKGKRFFSCQFTFSESWIQHHWMKYSVMMTYLIFWFQVRQFCALVFFRFIACYIQVFQFGTTRYKVKESVFICLFYPVHLAVIFSVTWRHDDFKAYRTNQIEVSFQYIASRSRCEIGLNEWGQFPMHRFVIFFSSE